MRADRYVYVVYISRHMSSSRSSSLGPPDADRDACNAHYYLLDVHCDSGPPLKNPAPDQSSSKTDVVRLGGLGGWEQYNQGPLTFEPPGVGWPVG